MTKIRPLIFILGLLCAVAPARAAISYYCAGCSNAASQFTSANLGVTLTSLITFTSGDLSFGVYDDPTGTMFDGFLLNNNGGSNHGINGAADSLQMASSTALGQTANGGIIEITNIPAGTFAFAFNLGATGSGAYCVDVNSAGFDQNPSCNSTINVSSSSDSEFVGVFSSGVGAVPITTIWIGPQSDNALSVNNESQINSFELEQATPEAGTLVSIGSGLLALGVIRRRLRISGPA